MKPSWVPPLRVLGLLQPLLLVQSLTILGCDSQCPSLAHPQEQKPKHSRVLSGCPAETSPGPGPREALENLCSPCPRHNGPASCFYSSGPCLSASMWQQMTAMKGLIALPLTFDSAISLISHSGMFPRFKGRSLPGMSLSVILFNCSFSNGSSLL